MRIEFLLALCVLLAGCIATSPPSFVMPLPSNGTYANDARNPFLAQCHWQLAANGAYLPDPKCSPGLATNATLEQVCTKGYSASVRNVPQSEKDAVFAEYGITSHNGTTFEVDHIISLELGGSNDISNLFPQPAAPVPGFHEKDKIENSLHAAVCSGSMPLVAAQQCIASDWTQCRGN